MGLNKHSLQSFEVLKFSTRRRLEVLNFCEFVYEGSVEGIEWVERVERVERVCKVRRVKSQESQESQES